jgi:hypothetical protein
MCAQGKSRVRDGGVDGGETVGGGTPPPPGI